MKPAPLTARINYAMHHLQPSALCFLHLPTCLSGCKNNIFDLTPEPDQTRCLRARAVRFQSPEDIVKRSEGSDSEERDSEGGHKFSREIESQSLKWGFRAVNFAVVAVPRLRLPLFSLTAAKAALLERLL